MREVKSAFEQYAEQGYPWRYRGHIVAEIVAGGTPTNPDVAEAWLRAKGYGGELKDDLLREQVAEIMRERGVNEQEAVRVVAKNRHLSGFRRDDHGLYIEARQLKACLKEAASVAADVGKLKARGLGQMNSRKGILSFMAEHVFVVERNLYLGVEEPTDVVQSFVHTFRGSGIQLSEVVEPAEFDFHVETDREFEEREWAMLWLTAGNQGIGAARSQGYGCFTVTEWERELPASRRRKRSATPFERAAEAAVAAVS